MRDLLVAVLEALDVPAPATFDDSATHDLILAHRAMHARITLQSVANGLPGGVEWHARFLRERLAEHPPTGYRAWGGDAQADDQLGDDLWGDEQ